MESEGNGTDDESNIVTVTAVKGKVSVDGLATQDEDMQVNCMCISQTQKYFAVGTENGFMIIQNDASMSMKKLKKSVVLSQSVVLIEMIYNWPSVDKQGSLLKT